MSHYKQGISWGPSMGLLNGHDIMGVFSCTLCADKSWKIVDWLTKLFKPKFSSIDTKFGLASLFTFSWCSLFLHILSVVGVKPHFVLIVFFFVKILFIYLFIEKGREGQREGEKYRCMVASWVPPTGDLACNPGMCPDWESNQ
ncbi:hypothetical protein HJG60_008648 [Phyllostomus discolor]|uniref:Uncharacterized protein n=1 Tax=Phyllostomus discolor TaxID=89673 RepID=A0A834DLB3_9CHIR|nr:hypothetical protein HJG60_008648 [Phyllostomus discolor]